MDAFTHYRTQYKHFMSLLNSTLLPIPPTYYSQTVTFKLQTLCPHTPRWTPPSPFQKFKHPLTRKKNMNQPGFINLRELWDQKLAFFQEVKQQMHPSTFISQHPHHPDERKTVLLDLDHPHLTRVYLSAPTRSLLHLSEIPPDVTVGEELNYAAFPGDTFDTTGHMLFYVALALALTGQREHPQNQQMFYGFHPSLIATTREGDDLHNYTPTITGAYQWATRVAKEPFLELYTNVILAPSHEKDDPEALLVHDIYNWNSLDIPPIREDYEAHLAKYPDFAFSILASDIFMLAAYLGEAHRRYSQAELNIDGPPAVFKLILDRVCKGRQLVQHIVLREIIRLMLANDRIIAETVRAVKFTQHQVEFPREVTISSRIPPVCDEPPSSHNDDFFVPATPPQLNEEKETPTQLEIVPETPNQEEACYWDCSEDSEITEDEKDSPFKQQRIQVPREPDAMLPAWIPAFIDSSFSAHGHMDSDNPDFLRMTHIDITCPVCEKPTPAREYMRFMKEFDECHLVMCHQCHLQLRQHMSPLDEVYTRQTTHAGLTVNGTHISFPFAVFQADVFDAAKRLAQNRNTRRVYSPGKGTTSARRYLQELIAVYEENPGIGVAEFLGAAYSALDRY